MSDGFKWLYEEHEKCKELNHPLEHENDEFFHCFCEERWVKKDRIDDIILEEDGR